MTWTDTECQMVRARGYHAIYFASSLESVTVLSKSDRQMLEREGANIRLSDVKGEEWPVKVGITAALRDRQTSQYDFHSPHYTMRVHWRLWARDKKHATFLQFAALKSVQSFPESKPMRGKWLSGGPVLDFNWVLYETSDLATQHGVWHKTDEDLKAYLGQMREGQLEREINNFTKRGVA